MSGEWVKCKKCDTVWEHFFLGYEPECWHCKKVERSRPMITKDEYRLRGGQNNCGRCGSELFDDGLPYLFREPFGIVCDTCRVELEGLP